MTDACPSRYRDPHEFVRGYPQRVCIFCDCANPGFPTLPTFGYPTVEWGSAR